MPAQLLSALILFAFVSSITPGPNNMMLMASGVNFGLKRTIPHMLGVALGFAFMLFAVGLGIGQLFTAFPILYTILKLGSILYMLWLAYKIATAEPSLTPNGETRSKPMTFWNAVAFQWINPKAWTMCLTGVTAYTVQSNYLESLIIMTLVYMLVNLPSVSAWAVFGVALRGFLADAKRVRIFNIIMAIILVVSLWPVAASLIHDGQVAHI